MFVDGSSHVRTGDCRVRGKRNDKQQRGGAADSQKHGFPPVDLTPTGGCPFPRGAATATSRTQRTDPRRPALRRGGGPAGGGASRTAIFSPPPPPPPPPLKPPTPAAFAPAARGPPPCPPPGPPHPPHPVF